MFSFFSYVLIIERNWVPWNWGRSKYQR